MNAKLPMLLVFLAAAGCAASPRAAGSSGALRHNPSAAANATAATPGSDQEAAPLPPAEALSQADLAYESQLGAARGQFSVDRQVAVLRQAVALYGQFLERAEGRPELEPAVRKSRERIEDAQATIDFLLGHMKDADGEPPHAPTD
jgi:hypothetical protein